MLRLLIGTFSARSRCSVYGDRRADTQGSDAHAGHRGPDVHLRSSLPERVHPAATARPGLRRDQLP